MRTRLIVIGLLLFATSAWGQFNQCGGTNREACVALTFYTGSNLTAQCFAPQSSPSNANRWSVALSNLTNIVVATNVGTINFPATAQYWVGMQITVSGSATTALNKTYRVTAVSGTTATITTSGVGDATYTDMTISTNNPVLNQAVWAIQIFTYDGSNNFTGSYWANSSNAVNFGLACSARATY